MDESERTQANLLRERWLQALGQMIAGVTHELNNPLAVVRGYAELLLRQDLPQQARTDLQHILKAVEHCQRVIDKLQVFTQCAYEQRGPIDINKVLEGALSLCAFELQTAHIRVERQLATELPLVHGNASLLQQVFFNIINNAQQAMSEAHQSGILTVRSCQRTEEETNMVRVEIHDDGPGIALDALDRIFDPFFTTKRPNKGMGLGLSICFGIVQEHNGHIWAECPALQQYPNNQGPGLTVIVELPALSVSSAQGQV